jgi:hypothetical protein
MRRAKFFNSASSFGIAVALIEEFERILTFRGTAARAAWSDYCAALPGTPRDAASLWSDTGGMELGQIDWAQIQSRHSALWHLLCAERIVEAKHSHGGRYFFADPCMYVHAPPARDRRRRIDRRLKSALAALPRRMACTPMAFSEWAGTIAALELVRTDLCSVLWHELAIRAHGRQDEPRLTETKKALAWCSRVTLDLCPPLQSSTERVDRDLEPSFSCPTLTPDVAPGVEMHASSVRSRRASDMLLRLWASLARLVAGEHPAKSRYLAFGNAFGAIDLAFDVAEALRAAGAPDATASVCRIGGREAATSSFVLWPEPENDPQVIIFCDDSITSGRTYSQFQDICGKRYPKARIRPFFLTYDLNATWNSADGAMSRFELADCATARAPWSRGMRPQPVAVTAAGDLIEAMLASSDEQLRWVARTQAPTILELNG